MFRRRECKSERDRRTSRSDSHEPYSSVVYLCNITLGLVLKRGESYTQVISELQQVLLGYLSLSAFISSSAIALKLIEVPQNIEQPVAECFV